MKKLPPGQSLTAKFPLVGEQAPLSTLTPESWSLTVDGLVDQSRSWDTAAFAALPRQEMTMDIHCVTGWSRLGTRFSGIPLADVLDLAGVRESARFVRFVAWSDRDHDTSLPLDYAREVCWLVDRVDGAALSREHGGPLRLVTPGRYFYKSLKWVRRIELLAEDVYGFWERESAYHNHADPLREERFTEERLFSAEQTRVFKALESFDAWRSDDPNTVIIKANLSNWKPLNTNFSGLRLKACRFRNAQLAGADFRGANLSLSNFWGADLTAADFTGADLEGVDFSGANLNEARLVDVALSATCFYRETASGRRRSANVDGHGPQPVQRPVGRSEGLSRGTVGDQPALISSA